MPVVELSQNMPHDLTSMVPLADGTSVGSISGEHMVTSESNVTKIATDAAVQVVSALKAEGFIGVRPSAGLGASVRDDTRRVHITSSRPHDDAANESVKTDISCVGVRKTSVIARGSALQSTWTTLDVVVESFNTEGFQRSGDPGWAVSEDGSIPDGAPAIEKPLPPRQAVDASKDFSRPIASRTTVTKKGVLRNVIKVVEIDDEGTAIAKKPQTAPSEGAKAAASAGIGSVVSSALSRATQVYNGHYHETQVVDGKAERVLNKQKLCSDLCLDGARAAVTSGEALASSTAQNVLTAASEAGAAEGKLLITTGAIRAAGAIARAALSSGDIIAAGRCKRHIRMMRRRRRRAEKRLSLNDGTHHESDNSTTDESGPEGEPRKKKPLKPEHECPDCKRAGRRDLFVTTTLDVAGGVGQAAVGILTTGGKSTVTGLAANIGFGLGRSVYLWHHGQMAGSDLATEATVTVGSLVGAMAAPVLLSNGLIASGVATAAGLATFWPVVGLAVVGAVGGWGAGCVIRGLIASAPHYKKFMHRKQRTLELQNALKALVAENPLSLEHAESILEPSTVQSLANLWHNTHAADESATANECRRAVEVVIEMHLEIIRTNTFFERRANASWASKLQKDLTRLRLVGIGRDLMGLAEEDVFDEVKIKKAFRQRALKVHPDKGGTGEDMRVLQEAYLKLAKAAAAHAMMNEKPLPKWVQGISNYIPLLATVWCSCRAAADAFSSESSEYLDLDGEDAENETRLITNDIWGQALEAEEAPPSLQKSFVEALNNIGQLHDECVSTKVLCFKTECLLTDFVVGASSIAASHEAVLAEIYYDFWLKPIESVPTEDLTMWLNLAESNNGNSSETDEMGDKLYKSVKRFGKFMPDGRVVFSKPNSVGGSPEQLFVPLLIAYNPINSTNWSDSDLKGSGSPIMWHAPLVVPMVGVFGFPSYGKAARSAVVDYFGERDGLLPVQEKKKEETGSTRKRFAFLGFCLFICFCLWFLFALLGIC